MPNTPTRRDRLSRIRSRNLVRVLGAGNSVSSQVLICFYLRLGQVITVDELVDFVWGGDEEGGPDSAGEEVKVIVTYLRQAGFRIETFHGLRHSTSIITGGYRLIPTRFIRGNVNRFVTTDRPSYRRHPHAFPVRKRNRLISRYRSGEPVDVIAQSEAVTHRTLYNYARAAGLRRRGYYPLEEKERIVARVAAGERFKVVAESEKVKEQTLQIWLTAAGVRRRNELWYSEETRQRVLERCLRGDSPSVILREEKIAKRTLYRWRLDAGLLPDRKL